MPLAVMLILGGITFALIDPSDKLIPMQADSIRDIDDVIHDTV
jgi:hypothetical protein